MMIAAAAEAEAAERRGEWRTPERLVASSVAGAPAGVRPFGPDTPRMLSKRPSAGGATNLPRAWCIGTKSSTRDGMVGEGSSAVVGPRGRSLREKPQKLSKVTAHPAIGPSSDYIQEKN